MIIVIIADMMINMKIATVNIVIDVLNTVIMIITITYKDARVFMYIHMYIYIYVHTHTHTRLCLQFFVDEPMYVDSDCYNGFCS